MGAVPARGPPMGAAPPMSAPPARGPQAAFHQVPARAAQPPTQQFGQMRVADGAPPPTYDWIVSNPPVHRGQPDDFSVVQLLIRGAPARLRRGGGAAEEAL